MCYVLGHVLTQREHIMGYKLNFTRIVSHHDVKNCSYVYVKQQMQNLLLNSMFKN
jgi:hypothetical protein